MAQAIAQSKYRGMLGLCPDSAERLIRDVAQSQRLPELIGMDISLRVDIADTNAGAVRATTIPLQQLPRFARALRILAEHAEIKIGAIRRLIDRQHFARPPRRRPGRGAIDDLVQSRARVADASTAFRLAPRPL